MSKTTVFLHWTWGVETFGGDGSKTGLVMKKRRKHKSTTGIGASLTPDYREKEESNNNVNSSNVVK